ncbi:MAG: amidophosphoribosyltransferase [Planctomycetota bacterium]|nr:amidophosphoribosyltransferase [Planctomycetota bacterium]
MSDFIGHECGLALVRLRKPLTYYRDRYDDPAWGLRRLFLLMEKQHNRGQDGAGVATVKFDMPPGEPYIKRIRSDKHNAIERLFDITMPHERRLFSPKLRDVEDLDLKLKFEFLGNVYLGHLRYGTHSGNALSNCHPLLRKHNIACRNLAIAGNFNMTNASELFDQLIEDGLNPVGDSDTQVILERLGFSLDEEHRHLKSTMGPGSLRNLKGRELAKSISDDLNPIRVLRNASDQWDGGYVFASMLGNGDCYICRDPAGIRPAFFHIDDEVVAFASERAALVNVFNVDPEKVEPIKPGHALVVKRDGHIEHEPFTEPMPLRQCTFERIYFSRGNDPSIYQERKNLGRFLAPRVLKMIDNDIENAIFSYITNTAETAYVGLLEGIEQHTRQLQMEELWTKIQDESVTRDDLTQLMNGRVRAEKIAHKDQRLRTFITHDSARRNLVAHIYDITRGVVKPTDTLVVLDDSIVRGTTLRESIITILSRLNPKRIVVASSAPPIMYPDCYGIDMSQLGRFIAFEAAIALLEERGESDVLDEVEQKCLAQINLPNDKLTNQVAAIYDRFTLEELSAKIAQLVRPPNITWTGQIDVIYQTVDDLRLSMPDFTGDWYFTGNYPTPGGNRVLNTSFLNWRQRSDVRAY